MSEEKSVDDVGFQRLLREAAGDPNLRQRIIEDPNWAADHYQLSPYDAYRLENFLRFRERSDVDHHQLEEALMKGTSAFTGMNEVQLLDWGKCLEHDTRKLAVVRGAPFLSLLKLYQEELIKNYSGLSSRNKLKSRVMVGHIDYLLGAGDLIYYDVLPTYRPLSMEE